MRVHTRARFAIVCGGVAVGFFVVIQPPRVRGQGVAPSVPTGLNVLPGAITVPPDTTFPTISLAAPAAGATVSGTNVTFSATASDNVSVVGVQFKVDGTNVQAEDMTAPYAIAWNSATIANGTHTVTAVARDPAGNKTTTTPVTITVSNGGSGGGLAALYPGDVGIDTNPNVVFVERFDEGSLSTLFSRWTDILNGSGMSFTTDAPPGSPLPRSLNIPWVGGGVNDGGHLYKQLSTGVDDTLYIRYYIKYPSIGKYHHTGVWMGGYNPPLAWPNPQAGLKPAGNDRFSAAAEQNSQTVRFDHYNYWMGMRLSSDGHYWGNVLLNNPAVTAPTGSWACVEQMVKLNNPVTSANGEHAIWLQGVKISHLGLGFPNGFWSGGIFTQSTSGTPFGGFQWRNNTALKINYIWLQNYSPDDPAGFRADMKFAHLVAARTYVGCLVPA